MNPPANWYPDPTGRHGQRYWDGSQWTEHVFTDGVQSVDPLETATSASVDTDAVEDTTDAAADTAGEVATSDGAAADPAPLPRRTRRDAPQDSSTTGVDEPIPGAEGLFSAAEDASPDEPTAPAEGLFTGPEDEDTSADEPTGRPEPAFAPAAGEDGSADASAAETWTPDEVDPSAEEDTVAPEVEPDDVVGSVEEATAPTASDFSDAFVLAPETASRLVGRGGQTPDDAAVQPPADDDSADVDHEETSASPDDASDPATTSDVIDAPPPTMPRPTTGGDLGITGDLVGGAFAEREDQGPVALQNSRMLRCAASGGIVARQGTMVAYQGDVTFERQGAGGVGRALKRAATGEGLAMMRVQGSGEVFFADGGQHVFLLQLDGGPGLSVNGRNILAFSASLSWDIERVKGATLIAGGLFNTTLTGRGWVALVSDGEPVVLRTDDAPTHVDVNALVAWSGGLATRITNTVTAKSLVGLGSGEAFQMAFDGSGIVIVQPSEGPMGGATAT